MHDSVQSRVGPRCDGSRVISERGGEEGRDRPSNDFRCVAVEGAQGHVRGSGSRLMRESPDGGEFDSQIPSETGTHRAGVGEPVCFPAHGGGPVMGSLEAHRSSIPCESVPNEVRRPLMSQKKHKGGRDGDLSFSRVPRSGASRCAVLLPDMRFVPDRTPGAAIRRS